MPTLTYGEAKGICNLAYKANKGEKYRFHDWVIWQVLDSTSYQDTGFRCILIQPEKNEYKNVTVLAFAGTDASSGKDILTDVTQALGAVPAQYHLALNLTHRYRSQYSNLLLTGHSLGGGLAAYSSVMTRLPAVTINPAPLVGAMMKGSLIHLPEFLGENPQIVNLIGGSSEIVSSSPGRNPGRDIHVVADGNYYTRHGLENVMPEIPLPQSMQPNWIEDAVRKAKAVR